RSHQPHGERHKAEGKLPFPDGAGHVAPSELQSNCVTSALFGAPDAENKEMAAAKQTIEVEGQPVTLTNLDKVLYPAGFTKAQVIDYYIRIAPWLLPHFASRPVTLHRFPEGTKGQSFYEKDAPKFTPAWVHTTDVPRLHG